jgi:hypothetical protein
MIYSGYTFQGCYSAISALQAYFLPIHGNREALVLGKLPYSLLVATQYKPHKISFHPMAFMWTLAASKLTIYVTSNYTW